MQRLFVVLESGHAGSWAGAYPEIVTCANKFWAPTAQPALAAEPCTGQLNPLNPKAYRVAQDVLATCRPCSRTRTSTGAPTR